MVEGLGSEIEGLRKEMEDGGAANLPSPFVVVLDEYGYYAVKGFAVAFAQGRSLGMSFWVGGQDMASFKKESPEEAVSVGGNTIIQCFGKIQDPGETMEFAVKAGGKAMIAKANSYDGEAGMAGTSYSDTMSAGVDIIDRINTSDIKDQNEGQFHVVVGSTVVRAAMFYVNPPPVPVIRLNHFIRVSPPDLTDIKELEILAEESSQNSLLNVDLEDRLGGEDIIRLAGETERALMTMRANAKQYPVEMGIAAVVGAARLTEEKKMALRGQLLNDGKPPAGETGSELFSQIIASKRQAAKDAELRGPGIEVRAQTPEAKRLALAAEEAEGALDGLEAFIDDSVPSGPVMAGRGRSPAMAHQLDAVGELESDRGGSQALLRDPGIYGETESVDLMEFDSVSVFLPDTEKARASVDGFGRDVLGGEGGDSDRATLIEAALAAPDPVEAHNPTLNLRTTIEGLTEIEMAMGAPTEEAAEAAATGLVRDMQRVTTYPIKEHVPPRKSEAEMEGALDLLTDELDKALNGDLT
jgi:hypothetical protein